MKHVPFSSTNLPVAMLNYEGATPTIILENRYFTLCHHPKIRIDWLDIRRKTMDSGISLTFVSLDFENNHRNRDLNSQEFRKSGRILPGMA